MDKANQVKQNGKARASCIAMYRREYSESSQIVFPLLKDSKTESYIKQAKTMLFVYDIRNNASCYVQKLKNTYKQACVLCSYDDFTKLSKVYEFNSEEQENAQIHCHKKAKDACRLGKNLVIIYNAFKNYEDIRFYVDLANYMKYAVIFEPKLFYQTDVCNLVLKQFPSPSEEKKHRPGNIYHMYFGWFLNENDSFAIRDEALMYLNDCLKEIPEFAKMFEKCNSLKDFASHFQIAVPSKEQSMVHCTTKYCGHNTVEAANYLKQRPVSAAYGQMSTLQIVGFIVSPGVLGARVKLAYKQLEVWDKDDDEKPNSLTNTAAKGSCASESTSESKTQQVYSTSSRCKITLHSLPSKDHDPLKLSWGRGRSAHLTLGHSLQATAKETNFDIIVAINREHHVAKEKIDIDTFHINKACVRRYGRSWIIYLKEILAVDGLFASYCCVK